MRRSLLVLTLVSCIFSLYAQKPMSIKMKDPVVCYGSTTNSPILIPPPEEYLRWKSNPGARIKTATIEVTYVGFSVEAQQAFQAAVDIWETLISSPVPIKVEARWENLGPGALGGALYTSAHANFTGAQKLNVFYPIALAEKIRGENLNGDDPDIFARFSSSTDWHFNPGTTPPVNKYDLVTVVLHEIGHGLGFASTFDVQDTNGSYGLFDTEVPAIFDVPIENAAGLNLIESFISPSANLRTQLTSTNLFFDSHTSFDSKLYAPATFNVGSSISHLDDQTFDGTANALMTHAVAPQERIHSPGVALNMLEDLGWKFTKINHSQFPGSEGVSGPYTITAAIESDDGYNTNSVKLHHTLDGTNFTIVDMAPTGNPNEFSGDIPSTGVANEYRYFISVNDNAGREFVNPGKFVIENNPQEQHLFRFETGPDIEAPKITHTPKGFILEADTELEIDAKVTDNLGVEFVDVAYYKNDNLIGTVPMLLTSPEEDSVYTATLDLIPLNLQTDDQLKYQIIATDIAVIGNVNGNIGYSPSSTDFHVVNVVGLEPTRDFYQNDFNSVTDDFFGNGFTVAQPAGFNNPAIQSTHPYPEGNGLPGDELNLIYQLKIPIRVKVEEATIKFDEVVLVEPGADGSVFGDEDFFDYVLVEGSTDGGLTWTPVADGYDSRNNTAWLTHYNSAISGNNSTAVGAPSLFRTRTLNLQHRFDTDDEVVLRFKLFSDPFAAGWGWCIDNLKIQIDETPPLVLHDHYDFLIEGEDALSLATKVSDASGVKSYKFEYFINSGSVESFIFDVDPPQTEYPFSFTGLSALTNGDVFNYRFVATDSVDIEGYFPPTGFIKVPIVDFGTPINQYANNFNLISDNFVGNFFSLDQPVGFANLAIHSTHNYLTGLGPNHNSDFTYMLKKEITISENNSNIRFDEIAIVEGHTGGAIFGTPAFNDYVIVEGSKDRGDTWLPFLDGYDAVEQPVWITTFNNQGNGTAAMFRTKVIDMTENGNFDPGDNVIIRFRLFSNETINGWGWTIDNLYIQDAITATENELERVVSVYPNPAKGNIYLQAEGLSSSSLNIQLMGVHGQILNKAVVNTANGQMAYTINGNNLPTGVYFVKISDGRRTTVKKVMKVN